MTQTIQKIVFVAVYTVLFSSLIFLGRLLFFPDYAREEIFVEPTLSSHSHEYEDDIFESFSWVTQTQADAAIKKLIYENYSQKFESREKDKVWFRFIPSSLEEDIRYSYSPIAEVFLYNKNILSRIQDMGLLLYKNRANTRGRMKWWDIHMYNPEAMTDSEFLSVLIHEFWHYYDIHGLKWNAFWDVSQKFYDISWDSVTVIRPWLDREDFVSWYSMTNQYEDFAETYTYFLLHNEDFAFRSLSNKTLQKKYDFMRTYVYGNNIFTLSSYSTQQVKEYYWDITKIPVDVKKFLQYMQEGI